MGYGFEIWPQDFLLLAVVEGVDRPVKVIKAPFPTYQTSAIFEISNHAKIGAFTIEDIFRPFDYLGSLKWFLLKYFKLAMGSGLTQQVLTLQLPALMEVSSVHYCQKKS